MPFFFFFLLEGNDILNLDRILPEFSMCIENLLYVISQIFFLFFEKEYYE